MNLNITKYNITLGTKYKISALLNTRRIVLKVIGDSRSHLRFRYRVDSTMKKAIWKAIPSEQIVCNLVFSSLRLK